MLDRLREEIKKELEKENKYATNYRVHEQFMSLLVLKYMCDVGEASYEEVIKQKEIEIVKYEMDGHSFSGFDVKSSLLSLIQYENLHDLVLEYLDTNRVGINFMNNHDEILCMSSSFNYKVYDITGRTTYVLDKIELHTNLFEFKFFDKVLNVNNKYLKFDEVDISSFKYAYVYNFKPIYRFRKNNDSIIMMLISSLLRKNKSLNVVLNTSFKRIANVRYARFELKYIDKIVLFDDDNSFVYFKNKDNKNISIINYNKNKISSLDKLHQIIDANRQRKDFLIKITEDDIKNNYYRIGFNLYQTELREDVRSINEIVDENTRLVEKLSSINITIEQEINNLINK